MNANAEIQALWRVQQRNSRILRGILEVLEYVTLEMPGGDYGRVLDMLGEIPRQEVTEPD